MVIQRHPRGPTAIDEADEPTDVFAAVASARPAWMRQAACINSTANFYPAPSESYRPALQVCGNCPVRPDCLAWALADPTLDYGALGGMTPDARKTARKLHERKQPR